MIRAPRIILSGGGTGGHIYPAIAIADEIKQRYSDADILFVGANGRMEMTKVPESGYPIKGLNISGIQRSLSIENLKFPIKLIDSLWKARKIVKAFKPDVVIGTGGYASAAVVKVASMMGVPTLIQEQNSYPGITNKWLGKTAQRICVAYSELDQFFPKGKIIHTGNPVRRGVLNVGQLDSSEVRKLFSLVEGKKVVLVLGGSLGARRINQLVESNLPLFKSLGVQLIWQCGSLYYEDYIQYETEDVKVRAFIDRMDMAYQGADVIISRAGASSVSELALVGKAVLFIPSPNVAEDHQTKNAESVVKEGGAVMIKEKNLEDFPRIMTKLCSDDVFSKQLGEKIKELAKPNATSDIVDCVFTLVK